MRLKIEHTTTYRYCRVVELRRHRLVLRPREGHDLRVEQMTLRLEPAYRLEWARDVFGNSIALVDWLEPSDTLNIVNDVVVERIPPFPVRELHAPWQTPFPPRYESIEEHVTAVYQQSTSDDTLDDVRNWLARSLTTQADDAEGTMLALCELVHKTIGYRRREEKGVQGAAQTLRLASGSCRDMATLMMEAARLLGVAARFASGYLHGTASMAGHASTHAWTEIYLPLLGWRGFDPTIGSATSLRHVVTGVSTHPRGVMPVSGSFVGQRSDCVSMTVSVRTSELPSELSPLPQ